MGNDATSFAVVVRGGGTDRSKLHKDEGGQSPREVVGHDGPDQSNNDDWRHRMGGGTTQMASQSWKTTRFDSGGTKTIIESDRGAT